MTGPWPLIGRERELEVVATALAALPDARDDVRTAGGGAAGVLLAGPAGVGKTRLAADFLAAAGGRDYPTARVLANRSARELPLGAFAALLPEWRELPDPAELLPQAVPAVTARAGSRPLVLMVDDAHDLDPTSAALLLQVVMSGRVFAVVTLRTGEAVPDPITRLWTDELVLRIELGPLEASEVARVLTRALDGPVDGGTVQALWNASGGNPLYLRELVTAAREAGSLREFSGIWHLGGALPTSARLSELVGTRLAGLEERAREAVEMVSLAEPLPLTVLERAVDLATVAGLEARSLLVVDGEPPAARLAHPVYGEVVRAELPSGRRRRMSRILADELEADRVPRPDDRVRIALWRIDAGDQPSPEVLVDAARQAHAASDWTLTVRLARAALTSGGGAQAGHLLGKSLDTLGDHAGAEAVLAEAEAAAVDEGERVLVVAARADNLYRGLGRAEAADALLRAAEADVKDPELIDGLRAQRAILDVLAGRVLDALTTAQPLLEPGDDRAYVQGGLSVATALAIHGRTAEAIEVADRAVAARLAFADGVQLAHPGVFFVARALALAQGGRLAEAEGTATAGYDGSARAQVADGQAWFSMILGHTHLLQGRLLDAIDRFREGAALFTSIGHPASRWCMAGIVLAAAQRADAETADAAARDLAAAPASPVQLMDAEIARAEAWRSVNAGATTPAVDQLLTAADHCGEFEQRVLEAELLHDVARLGAPEVVADRVEELATVVDGELMQARLAHVRALVTGDPTALEVAADRFEAMGALLAAAEASCVAAAAARRDGLARRASAAFQRAEHLLTGCQGARTPALSQGAAPAALTRREREVAMLAAGGRSSREIAGQLVVSVRTVENHLQRAYEKLGVRGRSDLAAVLENE